MINNSVANVAGEPATSFWRDLTTYDSVLENNFITPLEEAVKQHGLVPRALQLFVLQQLHWYFTVDMRERAPTVALTPSQAPMFHDRLRRIMQHIDAEVLEDLGLQHVSVEVRHALLSYKSPVMHSIVALDAYDHDQGLVRLSYYLHGDPPSESFLIDGVSAKPAYAKYRGCRYFHTLLLRQRIVWLSVARATELNVLLAGVAVPVIVGRAQFKATGVMGSTAEMVDNTAQLKFARAAYPPGKGGQEPLPQGWLGLKVRLLLALARLSMVRRKYAKAWVFVDRNENADDSAEHLYRWVRQNHPEVNAWFLLSPASVDWSRLAAEGFRLVPPGLMRQLLILNSEHIISSHAEYVFGGFDRGLYGCAMQWRYTFLQHGVINNDLSHWLGPREFDCFVTSSPAEHESIVGDDSAYPYTDREVRRTGLPRHDRLLQMSQQAKGVDVNMLLVMPTWRGNLVDSRATGSTAAERMAIFAASDYARHWRALLRNEELHSLATQHGQRVVFMPHPNAVAYVDAFDLPEHVQVVTAKDSVIQQVLASSVGFITDYTSVAFEMAFLRRPVFYYQFDRDCFYSGGHNWREGYFDYERDGFGPVAFTESELLRNLNRYFLNHAQPAPEYLLRMERAMPDRDDQACRRVFESVCSLRKPVDGIKVNL